MSDRPEDGQPSPRLSRTEWRKRTPTKRRDHSNDGPFGRGWETWTAQSETAYRRGFAQGAYLTLRALRRGATLEQVEAWLNEEVRPWRLNKVMWPEIPPDAPEPKEARQ